MCTLCLYKHHMCVLCTYMHNKCGSCSSHDYACCGEILQKVHIPWYTWPPCSRCALLGWYANSMNICISKLSTILASYPGLYLPHVPGNIVRYAKRSCIPVALSPLGLFPALWYCVLVKLKNQEKTNNIIPLHVHWSVILVAELSIQSSW